MSKYPKSNDVEVFVKIQNKISGGRGGGGGGGSARVRVVENEELKFL